MNATGTPFGTVPSFRRRSSSIPATRWRFPGQRIPMRCSDITLPPRSEARFVKVRPTATKALARVAEFDSSTSRMVLELGIPCRWNGMFPEAVANLKRTLSGAGKAGTDSLAMPGYVYGQPGQVPRAREVLRQLRRDSRKQYVLPAAFALLAPELETLTKQRRDLKRPSEKNRASA